MKLNKSYQWQCPFFGCQAKMVWEHASLQLHKSFCWFVFRYSTWEAIVWGTLVSYPSLLGGRRRQKLHVYYIPEMNANTALGIKLYLPCILAPVVCVTVKPISFTVLLISSGVTRASLYSTVPFLFASDTVTPTTPLISPTVDSIRLTHE